MSQLFSRWESGIQITAGTMVGSIDGASGLNNYSDRLNSLSTDDNLITGSMVSGTSTNIITPYQDGNFWTGSMVSGTNLEVFGDASISGTNSSFIGSFVNISKGFFFSGLEMKLLRSSTVVLNTGETDNVNIPHGLGVEPAFMIPTFDALSNPSDGGVTTNITQNSSSTNVQVQMKNHSSAFAVSGTVIVIVFG